MGRACREGQLTRVGLVSLSAGMGITHMNEKISGTQTVNKGEGGSDPGGVRTRHLAGASRTLYPLDYWKPMAVKGIECYRHNMYTMLSGDGTCKWENGSHVLVTDWSPRCPSCFPADSTPTPLGLPLGSVFLQVTRGRGFEDHLMGRMEHSPSTGKSID